MQAFGMYWQLSGNPLSRHVRILKSDDAKATLAESRGEEVHEWRIHAGARTMSQCDGSVSTR